MTSKSSAYQSLHAGVGHFDAIHRYAGRIDVRCFVLPGARAICSPGEGSWSPTKRLANEAEVSADVYPHNPELGRSSGDDDWYLDETFDSIRGQRHQLQRKRDRCAAERFFHKVWKGHRAFHDAC